MTTLEKTQHLIKKNSEASQMGSSNPSTLSKSFEEVYKTSYSHGLESIYALETIDIKSVRPIQTIQPSKIETPKKKKQKFNQPDQLEFDFGDGFSNTISPFIKAEPIHVLGLSKHAEKCLLENNKLFLDDLIGQNLNQWVSIKGMGQGHIEEVRQKLQVYVGERPLEKTDKVDFLSWINSLVAAHDKRKIYVLLEKFGLSEMISLSPSESVDVKKLTLEKKQEWIQDILTFIATDENKNKVFSETNQIFTAFIKPWIALRGGFATTEELSERFERISEDRRLTERALDFMQNCFLITRNFLQLFLREVDNGIYSASEQDSFLFDLILAKAKSYFYKPGVYYTLIELVALLEKEFAKNWIGFREGYLKKVLKLSTHFEVSRSSGGSLTIHKVLF
jgi:hypothetical protein